MKKILIKLLTSSLLVLLFQGCSYKPTSHYAKHEINGKVYVQLKVDINNATNSVQMKDAVNEMVVQQFGASLTDIKSEAQTIINVALGSVSHVTLQTDNDGYAKLYRTTVNIDLNYHNVVSDVSKTITVSSSYDYSIDDDSLITDAKKTEAIKVASAQALEDIFSSIAIQSFKKDIIEQ